MKLSIIIPSFYPATIYGGPIFTSLYTAQELSKLAIEVKISTTNANMTERLKIKPNIWHKKNPYFFVKYYNETIVNKFSFSLISNLWKDIKQSDIVHIQGLFSYPIPVALFYAKVFNKKVLLTPHGTLGEWCLENGSQFKPLWIKLLIKPFNKIIIWHATAEMEKKEILRIFPDANIQVIPNGIQIEEFENFNILNPNNFIKKFTKKTLKSDKIIVSMGRLQEKKGFDILIESFVNILQYYPNAKLLIAGQDEGEKENLEKQIENLSLVKNVFLIGQIKGQDKIDFLANADIFALPSHNENFGIVYTESLAAGTPILASKNTPWQKVEEANCGKWVNNTVKETSQAILEMLKQDREEMRKNSKKFAQKYDWKNIALEFKKLLNEMRKK